MAWANLAADLADLFASDRHVLEVESIMFRRYLQKLARHREYAKTPDGIRARKRAQRRYQTKPEVRARRREWFRAWRASRRAVAGA